jgi:predicted RNase H-like HicB family nuclease
MQMTAIITPAEEGGFIALNPETGTTTQGESIEEAIANLREATALYLEEFPLLTKGHPLVTVFNIPAHAQVAKNFGAGSDQGPGVTWL